MLQLSWQDTLLEAGCDEAGRGCLAGPVVAAAVILPAEFKLDGLNDSKKMTEKQRERLRPIIEEQALAWAVAFVDAQEIDEINILNASILAMHRALEQLHTPPQFIAVDGNRFKKYQDLPHICVVKGDAKLMNIAAASVLAKTHRDEWMLKAANEYPQYDWQKNKGYPTLAHRKVVLSQGLSRYHRRTFHINELQTKLALYP